MATGFGPHDIVSLGEIAGTLIVLTLSLVALVWMGQRTRHSEADPHHEAANAKA